jgi:hypothetical protein
MLNCAAPLLKLLCSNLLGVSAIRQVSRAFTKAHISLIRYPAAMVVTKAGMLAVWAETLAQKGSSGQDETDGFLEVLLPGHSKALVETSSAGEVEVAVLFVLPANRFKTS